MPYEYPKPPAKYFVPIDDSWRTQSARVVEWTLPSGVVAKYHVPPWEDAFIKHLSEMGSVRKACFMTGQDRKTIYAHRGYSPPFAERWDLAIGDAYDKIWEASFDRGVVGVQEPVFYQGEIVGEITKYSDRLLETMLKGTRPQMFRNAPEEDHNTFNKPQVFLPEIIDEDHQLPAPSPVNSDPDQTHQIDALLKPSMHE